MGCAASAQDLGFLGLLSDDYTWTASSTRAIGPVLAYGGERLTDLIRTHEAYFASGSSRTNAGEALHVHPNTVARRLERISELLGGDCRKPGQALEAQPALRLQRIRGGAPVLQDRFPHTRREAVSRVGTTGRKCPDDRSEVPGRPTGSARTAGNRRSLAGPHHLAATEIGVPDK
ncbi:helix-turn-helix domain-containing protein [Streptomyces sp. NPDC094143]|uniref:helix-turn-helix domain-containing protein n=1 Tax=Streptomyces sp. NPDC094143 TaxID=3155310 RepID=UPI003322F8AA